MPGEVVVGYENGAVAKVETRGRAVGARARPASCAASPRWPTRCRTTSRTLRQFIPNDPYLARQWNFVGPYGIGMPEAWSLAAAAGAPGGQGATVAVLDSGVAFERYGGFRRAPDLRRSTFVHPWDFVDRDRHPNDRYGHGTHVTGTLAEATNNGLGRGRASAYGVKIMPLKVLDDFGEGDCARDRQGDPLREPGTARDVINLSLEFDRRVVAGRDPRDPVGDPLRPRARRGDRGRRRQHRAEVPAAGSPIRRAPAT